MAELPESESPLEAARRGEAWGESELSGLIRGFARHVCRQSPEGGFDWEGVAQEASRRFFSVGLDRIDPSRPERAYLYAIVRSAFLHLQRTTWRRRRREEAHSRESTREPPTRLGELAQVCLLRGDVRAARAWLQKTEAGRSAHSAEAQRLLKKLEQTK